MIGRREFITLLGGAAAWPVAARAQQGERVRRIGLMLPAAEGDPETQKRVTLFRQALQQLGWADRNIQIDYRFGVGEAARARTSAAEIVALAPDVILVNGTPPLAALQEATHTIPIVFTVVVDPVGAGFVQNLARPGGNITGFSSFEPEIGGKWLELLKEVEPGLRRVAGILDPAFTGFAKLWRAIEHVAPRIGLEMKSVALHAPTDDIESAIGELARESGGALIVMPTAINTIHRDRIISLASRHRLPAVYPFPFYAASGGLMCYGPDTLELFRRSVSYVDRILKGEKPADLPVQAPTKFELVINLKTAKTLGLDIPLFLQQRADEVIE
jgi:putative ABC transport system substrate-binding protein